ncbi:hypothetical protein V0R39_11290 [Pseudomonas inefficax]|nr:hypothetical protein [Pseudomonas inefficax]MEE1985065.1 hypothetical protein [Pseudomonas inefficax]
MVNYLYLIRCILDQLDTCELRSYQGDLYCEVSSLADVQAQFSA